MGEAALGPPRTMGVIVSDDSVVIRHAEAADRPAVVAIWRAAGLTRPWNDPDSDFSLALDSVASTVLTAWRSDVLVGAAVVGEDGHRGALYYLGVDPAAQRCGVGRALVAAAEGWCRARGMPKLNLLVRAENKGVLAFYEALGYQGTHCVSLYHTLDEAVGERERVQKAAWAASLG